MVQPYYTLLETNMDMKIINGRDEGKQCKGNERTLTSLVLEIRKNQVCKKRKKMLNVEGNTSIFIDHHDDGIISAGW